jgi:hypothetical protein
MRPPGDRPIFPTHLAEELATELIRLASRLEDANTARARARDDLPEFQCTAADDYRESVSSHLEQATDAVELLRRTAGQLRDAIADHEAAADVGTPVP